VLKTHGFSFAKPKHPFSVEDGPKTLEEMELIMIYKD